MVFKQKATKVCYCFGKYLAAVIFVSNYMGLSVRLSGHHKTASRPSAV